MQISVDIGLKICYLISAVRKRRPTNGSIAQLGEHLPYKQRVIGSSPIGPIDYGWIPEWPKGADCKSVGTAFEGSNPSPST